MVPDRSFECGTTDGRAWSISTSRAGTRLRASMETTKACQKYSTALLTSFSQFGSSSVLRKNLGEKCVLNLASSHVQPSRDLEIAASLGGCDIFIAECSELHKPQTQREVPRPRSYYTTPTLLAPTNRFIPYSIPLTMLFPSSTDCSYSCSVNERPATCLAIRLVDTRVSISNQLCPSVLTDSHLTRLATVYLQWRVRCAQYASSSPFVSEG